MAEEFRMTINHHLWAVLTDGRGVPNDHKPPPLGGFNRRGINSTSLAGGGGGVGTKILLFNIPLDSLLSVLHRTPGTSSVASVYGYTPLTQTSHHKTTPADCIKVIY